MSITKCPGHMRSLKLNFGLESENFRKFKTLLSESFGGNCARASRLTAVGMAAAIAGEGGRFHGRRRHLGCGANTANLQ